MTIFQYLNSLLYSKKTIDMNCDDESQFNLFMVNRWSSMYSPEMANYINESSNKYWSLFDDKQNQYNYIRMGDSSATPGTSLASNNLYSPNGLNHCKKYYIVADTSFEYIWTNGSANTVSVPSGYYYLNEINDLLKNTMISNHHYYTKNQVGLNPDPYRDVLTFLLNISYNTIT